MLILTVEGDKEDKVTDTETEKESVVDNVISTISNWMKEDPASEETDEVEDDEDDDEEDDEEEEEEEEIDENIDLKVTEGKAQNDSVPQKSGDINSLHNLPLGVTISSYSLQTEPEVEKLQSVPPKPEGEPGPTVPSSTEKDAVKTDIPVVKNVVFPGTNIAQVPSTDALSTSNEKSEPETNLHSSLVHSPASLNVPVSFADTTKLKENPSATVQIPQVPQDTSANIEDTQPDIQGRKETNDKDNANDDAMVETVTEPAVDVEEPLPLIDQVTPNPIESEMEELKIGAIETEAPATEEKVEENQNLEINTTTPLDVQKSLDQLQNGAVDADQTNPNVSLTMPPKTDDNTQNEISKNEEAESSSALPPLGLFNSASKEQNSEEPEGEDLGSKSVSQEETATEEKSEFVEEVSTQNIIGDGSLTSDIEQNEDINVSSEDNTSQEVIDMPKNSAEYVDEVKEAKEQIKQNDDTSEESVSFEDENIVGDFIEDANDKEEGGGIFSSILSLFGGRSDESELNSNPAATSSNEESSDIIEQNVWSSQSKESVIDYCDSSVETCDTSDRKGHANEKSLLKDIELSFNSDIFLYLLTTSISVIVFLFGYMILDRSRREAPLVARINKLEKELLITLKENELLQEKGSSLIIQEVEQFPNDVVEQLTQQLAEVQLANQALEIRIAELINELEGKEALEEQIESLEKELETSTEVGMELNRIISEMLDPKDGSEKLKENVEQLQRQLLEQKDTINSVNTSLKQKESENRMMHVELEKSKKKGVELQSKLEEMVDKVLQIEKEKDQQQSTLQNEVSMYHQKYSEAVNKVDILNNEIQVNISSSYKKCIIE